MLTSTPCCHEYAHIIFRPLILKCDTGWTVYNPLEEYTRIGLVSGEEGGAWKVSEFNANFATCPTYPEIFVVPATVTDKTLEKVAEFRSKVYLS
jgi:myotubularin-related protein 6/7/8